MKEEDKKPLLIEPSDIRKAGSSSLVVTLTHACRELGLDAGDYVKVTTYDNKIVIQQDETRTSGKKRVTFNIDPKIIDGFKGDIDEAIHLYTQLTKDNLWDVFCKVVEEHGDKNKSKGDVLREILDGYVSKWTKWYRILDRPLLKLKI